VRTASRSGPRRSGSAAGRAGAARRPAQTRRRLLDAAAAELIRSGGRAEMADIAKRAGASVGLSYHYFGSKTGLLAAVVEDFYDRYDAAVIDPNPLPGGDWAARERRRMEGLVDFCLGEPLAPIVFGPLAAEPEVAAVEARRLARHITVGAENIAQGQAQGHLPAGPEPHLLIGMIMGGLRHAIGQALSETNTMPRDRLIEELWRFVAAAAGLRIDQNNHQNKEGTASHGQSSV
jgi:AcrR family transcriptional regulator